MQYVVNLVSAIHRIDTEVWIHSMDLTEYIGVDGPISCWHGCYSYADRSLRMRAISLA